MKKISLYISTLVLLVFAIGCEEDDKFIDITQSIVAPSNLDVLYNITQDNTGNVTITPSAEAAHMFDVDFGDNSEIAAGLKPGSGVTHQYAEGTYQVELTAKGLNNLTASASFPLEVSFRAPENLVVTTTINQANPFEVSVEANADYAAYYHVFFGEDPDADPVQINAGELATHTYASVGTYTLRVVALSGGTATTEHTEEVVISAPTSLPIDFEIFDTTVFFDFGGTSHAIVANPDQSTDNSSETVAEIVKAGENWAGNVIITTEPIDFSAKTIVTMKVWSPRAGVNVLMKLENIDDDSVFKEVSAVTTSANSWETLSFDFSTIDTSKTYQKIVLFFDIGVFGDGSSDWTFYIDDIDQELPDTSNQPLYSIFSFETYKEIAGFGGGAMSIVANPDTDGNPSDKVAKLVKNAGEIWAGTVIEFNDALNFETQKIVKLKVWSPRAGLKLLFKLEQDANNFIELTEESTVANQWEEFTFDFSAINTSLGIIKAVFFIDFGVVGDGSSNYTVYIDDLIQTNGVSSTVMTDFETYKEIAGFGGGAMSIVANPDTDGNPSDKVAKLVKNAGEIWAGTVIEFNDALNFETQKIVKLKVWSPRAGLKLLFKLEQDANNFIELTEESTVANQWEEFTFDFSAINTSLGIIKAVFFIDFGVVGDGSSNYTVYIDDLVQL